MRVGNEASLQTGAGHLNDIVTGVSGCRKRHPLQLQGPYFTAKTALADGFRLINILMICKILIVLLFKSVGRVRIAAAHDTA